MTELEKMLETANNKNLQIHENYDFSGTRIKGLYCDGNIALSKDLHTEAEKKCILAEEIGHHETSSGNIIAINDISNRKQEQRARIWAYSKLISLSDLIDSYKKGCRNRYEIAEHLDVTEDFLTDCLIYYKEKYGLYAKHDNYLIYFEPLGVLELYG